MKKVKQESLKDLGIRFKETKSEKAFNDLYNRIRPGLFHYVNNILKSPEESDHVVSAVMSTVYDKIDTYDTKWHISTWIYRIAYTAACMELRYRGQRKTTPLSYFENSENKNWTSKIEYDAIENFADHLVVQEEQNEHNAEMQKVRRVISKLPAEYRDVIHEKFYNELSYEDIHKKLDIPIHTVKNRVARGKRIFKEIYEKES
jgi:RNA polymerase sigma-70 factor (ECF subfamily)